MINPAEITQIMGALVIEVKQDIILKALVDAKILTEKEIDLRVAKALKDLTAHIKDIEAQHVKQATEYKRTLKAKQDEASSKEANHEVTNAKAAYNEAERSYLYAKEHGFSPDTIKERRKEFNDLGDKLDEARESADEAQSKYNESQAKAEAPLTPPSRGWQATDRGVPGDQRSTR
jgi:hypothetical protein